MPEIAYKEFESHLGALGESPGEETPQAYLFHGEELLYKKAYQSFLEKMLPSDARTVNCEPVDGSPENIRDAVNRANTYSMLAGRKIVVVQESRIFYGKKEQEKFLEKAKEALDKDQKKRAANFLLDLLGQMKMTPEDIREEGDIKALLPEGEEVSEYGWVVELASYSRENGLSVPSGDRPDQFLENAVEKGFPKGNYLALTTDVVDRRKTLFKTIREKGVVVDCSVPKGNRRADRIVQEEVLKGRAASILGESRKKLMPQAFSRLYDLTGFDLRTFSNNLEKLVLYVADRPVITEDDVSALLKRSKQDPIYELTGAVSDRNPKAALALLDSILQSGFHILQVFTAIVNQFRKLLRAKEFQKSQQGSAWQKGMPYNAFTARVLPAMSQYDAELVSLLEAWDEMLCEAPEEADSGKRKGRKKRPKKVKVPGDLMTAPNPKNPYPIYLSLKKADKFRLEELKGIFTVLADTDIRLKRSARDPRILLEEVILKICR